MPKVYIERQDQFGRWHQIATKNNERDAFRVASARAKQTGQRHRIVDEQRHLLDILE
jgi:hypothetical protein